MDQRVAFIADWLRDEWTMSELAARYRDAPQDGLQVGGPVPRGIASMGWPSGRAPKVHGRAMADAVRRAVIALRRSHPALGAETAAVFEERIPEHVWPAASTLGDLLRRRGLSQPRRRPRYGVPLTQPLAAAQAPNDVWTADFKGWFRPADGMRCDPLTIVDACSRFVFCCRIVPPHARVRGAAVVRPHISDVWVAAGVADRQWAAVCHHGRGPVVGVGGVVVEARHPGGSHCPGASGAEWPPRAVSPDAATGDGDATRTDATATASALRSLAPRV